MSERLKEIQEKFSLHEWYEGFYLNSSDIEWLIQQAETLEKLQEQNLYSDFINRINELEKEIKYLREANSINGEVNQSMNEKIKQYEKAVEAFKSEYEYEHGWEVRNGEGNKRSQWHKGALRGFEHVKEIFDKHFK